jgi:S1-C subfamily serine protease
MTPDPPALTTASRREVLALVVAGGASLAGCSAPSRTTDTNTPDASETEAPSGSGASGGPDATAAATQRAPAADDTYAAVYEESIPSVVLVRVYGPGGPLGQGSGFVFPDGSHVVTNQHVVDGARTVRVRFHDGTWTEAELLGTDVYSDLAVLSVDAPATAPPLSLVEREPPVGTQVVALGAPFSFGGSVSAGIVSGVDRSLPSQTGFSIPDAVQTDAAVNPGNSGGPLVSLDGAVVAVINSGQGENVNFGISAALTGRVVPALVERGEYDHAYMGVRLLDVTPAVAAANDLDRVRGVLVVDVASGGPAASTLRGSGGERTALGQRVPVGGDVVLALDGRPTPSQSALATHLAIRTSPGDTLAARVFRGGTERTVSFELGARPDPE